MSKKNRFKVEEISRLMLYVLGHKPYEFGLVPTQEGFVTVKELLQAFHEEQGWGYVREGHINEVMLGESRNLFQIEDKQIRARERHWYLDFTNPADSIPKLLFIGIRKRAHPAVLENGLRPMEQNYHILTHDITMARRIGNRRDNQPVILEVLSDTARKEGSLFFKFGELFLVKEIPPQYIFGPPAPKTLMKAKVEKIKKREKKAPELTAGTFILDQDRDMDISRRGSGKKKKSWKDKAKKTRRSKKGYL